MRVVFFGSSQNVFSGRFYQALRQADCEIAAVVDVPAAKRCLDQSHAGRRRGRFGGRRARMPASIRRTRTRRSSWRRCVALAPDLFLAVGYMLRLGRRSWPFPALFPPTCTPRSCRPTAAAARYFGAAERRALHRPDDSCHGRAAGHGRSVVSGPRADAKERHGRLALRSHHRQGAVAAAAADRRRPARSAAAKGPAGRGRVYFSAAKQSDFRIDCPSRPRP